MATEFVGIELQLMGADGVRRDLENLDKLLHSLGGRKKFDAGFNEARTQVVAFKGELENLKREYSSIIAENKKIISNSKDSAKTLTDSYKKGLISLKEYREAFHELASQSREAASSNKAMNAEIDATRQKMWNAQQGVREFGQASREAGRTFTQTFNAISSRIAHAGGAMESLGNSLNKIASPFKRLMDGTIFSAGYKFLNLMTEGFASATKRADILSTYIPVFRAMGAGLDLKGDWQGQLSDAYEKVYESVVGLPTGIDEIVNEWKLLTIATQDYDKAADLAIAANNAILASGADDTAQQIARRELRTLLTTGKLTERQWDSLRKGIPVAWNSIEQDLKKENKISNSLLEALKSGDISANEFANLLIDEGINGKTKEVVNEMLHTYNAATANIRNAFSNMGKNILGTLDEILKGATGKDTIDYLIGMKEIIGLFSEGTQGWMRENADSILKFIDAIKSVNWGSLAKGFGDGLIKNLERMTKILELFKGRSLERIGRFLAKTPMWATGFTVLGGAIRGLRGPLAFIFTLASRGGGRLSGIFGKIASLFGKKKDIEDVGEIGKAVTTASPKLLSAFKNMALISGIVSMPAFTAWGVTAAVKNSIKNFKETIDLLKGIKWSDAKKVLLGIGGFLGVSAILGGIVGNVPGAVGVGTGVAIGETVIGVIMSIATGFADLNMTLIKDSIKKFVESVKLLGEIPDVSSFGDVKNKISNAITMLNEISTLFQGRYVDMGVKEGGIQGAGLFTGFSVNSIAKALEGLKKAVKAVQDLADVSIPEGAADNIKRAVNAVSEASSNMWKLWGFGYGSVKNNTENIIESLTNLKKIIKQINGLKGVKVKKGGITAVKNAITNIGNAFDATAIGDIRVKITAFVASIQDAFTMFDKLNKTITIEATVKLSKGFKSSVDEVVRQINSARSRIRRAWNNIPDSLSKTITLTVNGKVNASGALNGISKGVGSNIGKLVDKGVNKLNTPAMGGLIYRAHGGGVPFKRRGTDTVPAMLTPGEYVHNKRAVNTFGIDFMRKVNNLDMKGAMNELMHRAGHMANINRGTNITNNNYNNQKVVINNSNAGAGYTFRTASRFVGAF